jgi:hypothetical protein
MEGTCIVLTTGRKDCTRCELEAELRLHGLFWDHLIMGLPRGPRVVVNDVKPDGASTAFGCNLLRNAGLAALHD